MTEAKRRNKLFNQKQPFESGRGHQTDKIIPGNPLFHVMDASNGKCTFLRIRRVTKGLSDNFFLTQTQESLIIYLQRVK